MPAVDYIQLLEQGVDAWNSWRSKHPDEHPDLESAYLFEKSLPGINLSHVNLRRACLIGADLTGADLTQANLQGVYANNVNLQNANLTGADLQDGNLMEANLTQAELSDAVTDNTNFTNALLTGTCITDWVKADTPEATASPQADPKAPGIAAPSPYSSPTLAKSLLAAVAIVMPFAIATTILYRIFGPKPAPPVVPQDSISFSVVCNESKVLSTPTGTPDYTYPNGTQFYGQIKGGQPADGRGTMVYGNGNRYDGDYKNGQRNGCGTFYFQTGRRYVGQFEQDLFSGRGVWFLENGDRYIGDFQFNRCNGGGIYIFADGTSKSGIWQQGRLVNSELSCELGQSQSSKPAGLAYVQNIPNMTPPADGGSFEGAPNPTPATKPTPHRVRP